MVSSTSSRPELNASGSLTCLPNSLHISLWVLPHVEVLAASLFQVNDLGVNTTVYRYAWGEGNEEVVRQFYDGPDPIVQGDHEGDVLSDAVARGEYDVVYLVTCEGTLWVRPRIMEEITKNPDVQLICLMHFVWQIDDYKKHYMDVAATGRMTIYVLSEAVKRLTVLKLSEWAQQDKYSGWDNVKVELFVPVSCPWRFVEIGKRSSEGSFSFTLFLGGIADLYVARRGRSSTGGQSGRL